MKARFFVCLLISLCSPHLLSAHSCSDAFAQRSAWHAKHASNMFKLSLWLLPIVIGTMEEGYKSYRLAKKYRRASLVLKEAYLLERDLAPHDSLAILYQQFIKTPGHASFTLEQYQQVFREMNETFTGICQRPSESTKTYWLAHLKLANFNTIVEAHVEHGLLRHSSNPKRPATTAPTPIAE